MFVSENVNGAVHLQQICRWRDYNLNKDVLFGTLYTLRIWKTFGVITLWTPVTSYLHFMPSPGLLYLPQVFSFRLF